MIRNFLIILFLLVAIALFVSETSAKGNHPLRYDQLTELVPFSENGKYGYRDKRGKVWLKPVFKEARRFFKPQHTVTLVPLSLTSELNKSISDISPVHFDTYAGRVTPCAPVRIDDEWRIMIVTSIKGATLTITLSPALPEGLIPFRINESAKNYGLFGYYDLEGREVISPRFTVAYPFSDGRALVAVGKNYGFIDTKGEMVIPLREYPRGPRPFTEGLSFFCVKNKDDQNDRHSCGFMDINGKTVIEPKLRSALDPVDGFIIAGYLDLVMNPYKKKIGRYWGEACVIGCYPLWVLHIFTGCMQPFVPLATPHTRDNPYRAVYKTDGKRIFSGMSEKELHQFMERKHPEWHRKHKSCVYHSNWSSRCYNTDYRTYLMYENEQYYIQRDRTWEPFW